MKKQFLQPEVKSIDDLYSVILDKSALTWEQLIIDIVEKEKMNVWDIDVSLLALKYLEAIKQLKLLDYKLSGKVIFAAALLLTMKSKLIDLERLFYWKKKEEKPEKEKQIEPLNPEELELVQSVPEPRTRKVTFDDLMSALKKAIDEAKIKIDRSGQIEELSFEAERLRKSEHNLFEKLHEVLERVKVFVNNFNTKKILFDDLVPEKTRDGVVWTFLPLLHLSNKGEIYLEQEECFKDLFVGVPDESVVRSVTVREE